MRQRGGSIASFLAFAIAIAALAGLGNLIVRKNGANRGINDYDFSSPSHALRSEMMIEARGDLRASFEYHNLNAPLEEVELQDAKDYGDAKLLFVEIATPNRNTQRVVRCFRKNGEGRWLPGHYDSAKLEADDPELAAAVKNWRQSNSAAAPAKKATPAAKPAVEGTAMGTKASRPETPRTDVPTTPMVPVVPKPEVKPVIPTPVVPMPEAKPVIPAPVVPKPEVTPEPKPVVPMPEVKPKPMLPKPEVTPEPKPLVPMPEVKPKLVLPKPEVTPEPKPVVPLPEVKPKPMVPKPAIEDTRTDDQKIEQAKADVKVLSAASRAMMMKDPDFQPEDFKLEMLKAFVENDKVLTDPWGKPYQFKLLPTTEGRPRIQFFTKSTNGTAIAWPVK